MVLQILLLLNFALAQTPTEKSKPKVKKELVKHIVDNAATDIDSDLGPSAVNRRKASFLATYNISPMDMLVPGKKGISLGYVAKSANVYELEYLSAKWSPLMISDLGTISDKRISFLIRRFADRNSFNFHYGVSYMETKLEFGNKLYNKVTGIYPYLNAFDIQTVGLQFGIGSEWIFAPSAFLLPFRIDWISITQPVYVLKREANILDYVSDPDTNDALENSIRFASWVPHLMVFKIQFGFAF